MRFAYLEDLLNGIYNGVCVRWKSIHYNGQDFKTEVVIFEGDWFNKCSYSSKIGDNYRKMFKMTFCDQGTLFLTDNESIKPDFSKEVAIKNSVQYFQGLGINIPENLPFEVGEAVFGQIVFKAISDYIIPIIFQADGRKLDDIEEKFRQSINKMDGLFSGLELGYTLHDQVNASAVMKVFDSDFERTVYENSSDLYAIPMDSFQPELQIKWLWRIPKVVVKVEDSDNPGDQTYTELIDGFLPYPFEKNQMFVDPSERFLRITAHKSGQHFLFPISDKKIKEVFVPRYFYYITYIAENKKVRSESFPNIKSHDQLEAELKRRAQRDLKKEYQSKLEEYYSSVCLSIEDILERLLAKNLTSFITKAPVGIEECKKILEHFSIDSQEMVNVLKLKTDDKIDIVYYAYDMLEEAVFELISRLYDQGVELTVELQHCLSKKEIEQHAERIKHYLNSEQLKCAIELREQAKLKYPERFKISVEDKRDSINPAMLNLRLHTKNIYQHLYDSLKKYYDYLTGAVPLEPERESIDWSKYIQ